MSTVSDVRQTGVKIMLDRERTLKFDLNAFATLEEKHGSVQVAMEKMSQGNMAAFRTMLWCGLVHEDPELTEQQVGSMVDMAALKEISEKIDQAMTMSTPSPDKARGAVGNRKR